MKNILYFTSHPIQYISPLLRSLNKEVELKVFYYGGCSRELFDVGFGKVVDWDLPLLDGYDNVELTNYSFFEKFNNRFLEAVNIGVIRVLWLNRKDSVIWLNGWSYFTDWLVILFAKIFGISVWLRSETPWNQEVLKNNTFKWRLKYLILKYVVFKYFVNKFLFIGAQNREFYLHLGVRNDDLVFTPYCVDNDYFCDYKADNQNLKHKLSISDDAVVILYVGKLILKKRPMDLLHAFDLLERNNIHLVFVGDGILKPEMERFCNERGLLNVHFLGFVDQKNICEVYFNSDIFVLPSGKGETWGLVVNEVMNFNKPIVVSKTCGCSFDLVVDGENGYIYDEGDVDDLTLKLRLLLDNKKLCVEMGLMSSLKVKAYSYRVIIDNLKKELQK